MRSFFLKVSLLAGLACLFLASCQKRERLSQVLDSDYLCYVSFDFLLDGGSAMWGFRTPDYRVFYVVAEHSFFPPNPREIRLMSNTGPHREIILVPPGSSEARKLTALLNGKPFIPGESRLDQTNIKILLKLLENRTLPWLGIEWQRAEILLP